MCESANESTVVCCRRVHCWLGKGRSRRQVLNDVSLQVRAGECVALVGGSGAGKSTLLRVALGMVRPDEGTVSYRGQAVQGRASAGYRALRAGCGVVLQDPVSALDPRWTVSRSVGEPVRLHHRDYTAGQLDRRVAAALAMVGLSQDEYGWRYPMDLSGGQAQRVALARALSDMPDVVFADEPMSAIDVTARVQLLEVLRDVRRARPSMALVVVSHDLGVVRHLADRIVVLCEGRVVERGSVEQIIHHPQHAYTQALVEASLMP